MGLLHPVTFKGPFTGSGIKTARKTPPLFGAGTQDQWVRFGKSETPADAEISALLDRLVPQLPQATNWNKHAIPDKYGGSSVAIDISWQIGDTTYILRDVFSDPDLHDMPDGLEMGCSLLVRGPKGEKSYPIMDYQETYVPFWKQMMEVAQPLLVAPAINDIERDLDTFKLKSFAGGQDSGVLYFEAGDRQYSMTWGGGRSEYTLWQQRHMSDEDLETYYATIKAYIEEHNAKLPKERRSKMESLEAFKAKERSGRMVGSLNAYVMSKEQFVPLLQLLESKIQPVLTDLYQIGDHYSPRPLLKHIARELLADPRHGKLAYRLHDDRDEVTYETRRGQKREKQAGDQYIELGKFEKRGEDGYRYSVNIREGGPGVMLSITDPDDIALVEKMIDIVKTLDTSHGGNWHLALMESLETLLNGNTTPEIEAGKMMPKIDSSLPDPAGVPVDDLQHAAGLLGELAEMLNRL